MNSTPSDFAQADRFDIDTDLKPLLSRLDEAVVGFDFNGRHMAAIRQDAWAASTHLGIARRLKEHVAGRLFMNDDVYVLFAPSAALSLNAEMSVAQRLTPRELKVGCMIAEGLTDKEIARKLGISAHTVREHCRRACAKLRITRRSAFVRCLFSTSGGTSEEGT